MDDLLVTCWHQNNDVKGYFSKCFIDGALICLGNNINSENEYVSTVYNFNSNYSLNDNEILFDNIKIVCKNEFEINKFNEIVNPRLNNDNEPDVDVKYDGYRLVMHNVNNYEYIIYPMYDMDIDYSYYDLNTCHIIKYKNYILISSFEKNNIKFENIEFNGIFIAILKFDNNKLYLNIATGKRYTENIYFKIGDIFKGNIEVNNELIKKLVL